MTVVHLISSLGVGGAESLLCDIVAGVQAAGIQQQVIYFYPGPNVARVRALGIPVEQITGRWCLYDPVFFVRLWRVLKTINPDCIHASLWAANWASRIMGKLLGIPVINVIHARTNTGTHSSTSTVRTILDALTTRWCTQTVVVAPSMRTYFPDAQVIHNGIDAQQVRVRAQEQCVSRTAYGLTPDDWVIGTVGSLVPVKNHQLLLTVCAPLIKKYPHVRVMIVGSGPLEQTVRTTAHDLNIAHAVRFVTGASQAYGYYPLFDCFVQPSDYEGLSIALLEALSCSIPALVAGRDGQHDVITHGVDGIVVPPRNPALLHDALDTLITDFGARARYATQGKVRVDRDFSTVIMIKKYVDLYKNLCA